MPGSLTLDEYDPAWPHHFVEEAACIAAAVGPFFFAVEHVGSTAVPGLMGKPVVDLAIAVASEKEADLCVTPPVALGYEYRGPHGEDPRRRYYVRNETGQRLAQIHLYICRPVREMTS